MRSNAEQTYYSGEHPNMDARPKKSDVEKCMSGSERADPPALCTC